MKCLYDCSCFLCDTSHIIIIIGDLNLPLIGLIRLQSAADDDIHSQLVGSAEC